MISSVRRTRRLGLVGAARVSRCGRSCCTRRRPESFAHRGSTGSSCWCAGSSASRAPHSVHSPGQSSRHSGWNGSVSTTASRSTGSRSSRSPSNRATSSSSPPCGRSWCRLVVDEELLDVGHDLVVDLVQAPGALTLQSGVSLAGDEHALHDRLEPQVELDRRLLRDAENLDAEVCGGRRREAHQTLRPRAAAELAGVEHERRSRVETHGFTSWQGPYRPGSPVSPKDVVPPQDRTENRRPAYRTVAEATKTRRGPRRLRPGRPDR